MVHPRKRERRHGDTNNNNALMPFWYHYHRWATCATAALTVAASLLIHHHHHHHHNSGGGRGGGGGGVLVEAFAPGVVVVCSQQRRFASSCLTRRRSTSPPPLRSYTNTNSIKSLQQNPQLRYRPSSSTSSGSGSVNSSSNGSSQSPLLSSASICFNNWTEDDAGAVWSHDAAPAATAAAAVVSSSTCNSITSPPPHSMITRNDKVVLASAAMATVVAFVALLSASGANGAWRYYLAGGICAATSHAVPVPVDVVKTRQQIDPTLKNNNVAFLPAARTIVAKEGVSALFLGLGPTIWGYFLEGSLKFGIYEVLKPAVQSLVATRWMAYVICGVVSGLVASVVLCPMEALRIRLVSEPGYARDVGGSWMHGGLKMFKKEGIFGLFGKGMSPMIAKQVPYTVTKNVSFDLMTRFAYSVMAKTATTMSAATSFLIPLTAAAIASILSCIASQPGDMLLSVINAHEGKQSTCDVAKQLWRSSLSSLSQQHDDDDDHDDDPNSIVGGRHSRRRRRLRCFRGQAFFVGMNTRFMHVGIIVTMQLLIYDMVKRLCGIAATGSV
jgi:solute carrier family 25 (mitochondrial phosphate transporter), member 3